MTDLPTGTVTFLLTDVEDSTRLWDEAPDTMQRALERHDEIVAEAIAGNDGDLHRPRGEGDSHFAVFTRPLDALAAATDVQLLLSRESWSTPFPVRVRIAIHTGQADLRGGDYYGLDVNRAARIRSLAHGGQPSSRAPRGPLSVTSCCHRAAVADESVDLDHALGG